MTTQSRSSISPSRRTTGLRAGPYPLKVAYQAAAVEPEVADALADLEEFRFQHQGEVLDVLREKDSSGMMSPTNSEERFLAGRGTETVIKAMNAGWDLDTYSHWLRVSLPGFLLDNSTGAESTS